MTLNSNNVCDACHGVVKNTEGKRHSKEKLTAIHDETCPGGRRR